MDYFPVFLDLHDQRCLVVGGASLAAAKARLLLNAGARVVVVAQTLGEALCDLKTEHTFEHIERNFAPADLDDAKLVIVATDEEQLQSAVFDAASQRNLPVNVADRPALSSFILPSIVDRSPITIAVSTAGASPVLARLLRGRLEASIPPRFGALATFAREFRDRVKQTVSEPGARRRFWEWVLDGPIGSMVLNGQESKAKAALDQVLADPNPERSIVGEVYLVGAGPGDPDLLTIRALRLLGAADVVVYDRLVSDGVLDLTRRDAERIYAGKRRSQHALAQETINDLLVRLAREGKSVLRLKGGDPFIFGRGGEEIDTLAEHGIPFQVVPGITAAAGCAAYAGIPLTHRDFAHSCVFVTGHLKDDTVNLDWQALVKPQQTVVIYMGLVGLPVISRELIRHGLDPSTPAALVEHGTTANQRVITGTLGTLPDLVEAESVRAPTLTIVGDVVSLHEKLSWYDPLRTPG